jgi:hypothetical protein
MYERGTLKMLINFHGLTDPEQVLKRVRNAFQRFQNHIAGKAVRNHYVRLVFEYILPLDITQKIKVCLLEQ